MIKAVQMSVNRSNQRLQVLTRILKGHGPYEPFLCIRLCSSNNGVPESSVSIGDIKVSLWDSRYPEYIPKGYVPPDPSQTTLKHLQWIMQKDSLAQDIFLIGPPGPLRRQIAMMYLELTNREVEYVSLSRDTTESDLKQRREISAGTAFYVDQSAVRAALQGRILVLEGIEKAERNVLPILNNLLENREMQLDDGRFLVAADRYDKLLRDHTKEELKEMKLVRVDERFRVIALGHPVPRYRGNPLDPPLRSRFQSRDITAPPFSEQLEHLKTVAPRVPANQLSQVLSVANAIATKESLSIGLPDFPITNVECIAKILNVRPDADLHSLIKLLYPYEVFLGKEGKTAVERILEKFEIDRKQSHLLAASVNSVKSLPEGSAAITLDSGTNFNVKSGSLGLESVLNNTKYVPTPYHQSFLAEITLSHLSKDMCIVGPRGCGKTVIVQKFADLLGYHTETIMLYQDMTSRDLLQQRVTTPSGDTTWRLSPLVMAALEGSLAILDGIHRINQGSFAVLSRLIHDRELQLFDGSRLISQDKYDSLKWQFGYTDEQMKTKGIHPIHPSFRMIGLAEPPVPGSSKDQWVTPEMLTMFVFHHLRPLSQSEELSVIAAQTDHCPDLAKLVDFVHELRASTDPALVSIASSLSTRQLNRIAHRLAAFPSHDLYSIIHKSCLARFLPQLPKTALKQSLKAADIKPVTKSLPGSPELAQAIACEVKDGKLTIGQTSVDVFVPDNKTKVPDILFYNNPQHLKVMEDMLKDFSLGEHLLLVGNQGVGKNKIIDQFLHLLNRPREYIQLHRDTTVQTLTLQPTVKDGVIFFEDSPLVKAVKLGHVLVVDEADKAPTNVTCILKTLVESGEMHLADGRRIIKSTSPTPASEQIIKCHQDFRMMVLANRPGFPFLGNDFFGAMGDIFSCHAIDNPDMESELAMLKQYGPSVPESTIKKLVDAFGELRTMADQGLISYPYSTREVVNIVKHIQKYPTEGLTSVVRNVFDFDKYSSELQDTIIQTMHRHGIPFGAKEAVVNLAKLYPMPEFFPSGSWNVQSSGGRSHTALMSLPVDTSPITIRGPALVARRQSAVDKREARAQLFSEQEAYWMIPMHENNIVKAVGVTKAEIRGNNASSDLIHVATGNPVMLYTLDPKFNTVSVIDLYDIFPSSGGFKPSVQLFPLPHPLGDSVLLHEETHNVILTINYLNGEVRRIVSPYLPETPADKRKYPTAQANPQSNFKLCYGSIPDSSSSMLFYREDRDYVVLWNGNDTHRVTLPCSIRSVHQVAKDQWVICDETNNTKFLLMHDQTSNEFTLNPLTEKDVSLKLEKMSGVSLDDPLLKNAIKKEVVGNNRVAITPDSFASIIVGFPFRDSSEVFVSPRVPISSGTWKDKGEQLLGFLANPSGNQKEKNYQVLYLSDSGQVIRGLPPSKVPAEVQKENSGSGDLSGYMEVADIVNHNIRYIPVPGSTKTSHYASWLIHMSDSTLFMAPSTNEGLVTVDIGGCVRLWETAPGNLGRSLQEWKNMIGFDDGKPLQVTYERESGRKADGPKHGKVDKTNAPHVGGNTWAGGTGGSNTAGMGGIGGPYRLDAGHKKVYQVPQHEKDSVPESVRQAAREMAQKAFKDRLKEINMSEYDAEMYESFSGQVRAQVQSLRVILDSLQAKGKERQWLKNQTYGDIDDAKLIDGITGEKSIFKRRGEKPPELGTPQEKPKRLRLLVDVSGSMYRFNGYDGRLEREMEATLMMMEALEGYEEKIKYDIIGHSGENHKEELVRESHIPANNKERLVVLKTMHAHSQFCMSGDNTLQATKHAIETLSQEEADEHFVIILSDANFDRYGIPPKRFGEILRSNDKVNAYTIFIGSLEDQADRLIKQLPMGHAFICMDTKSLPQILQQIFTSAMLTNNSS